jgi:hypothetical protein
MPVDIYLPNKENATPEATMKENEILQAIRDNIPFRGLPNVRVRNLVEQSQEGPAVFDAKFELEFDETRVEVYAEVKNSCTPKLVEQIAPWLSQMKARQKDAAFALVCPRISPQSQALCFERKVDFIDLAGNVFISVPGKLLLQRVGQESTKEVSPSFYRNPFSGKSSRVVRVLLQKPEAWTLTELNEELASESRRSQCDLPFDISFSFASRVLRSLEEELLITRTNSTISVPEPRRLLNRWAQEYKDRYRWYLRRSFKISNPFGADLQRVRRGLDEMIGPKCYAFTGAAAANLTAPFLDFDPIDLFVADESGTENLQASVSGTSIGPDIRVIKAFDAGVFMYRSFMEGIPLVSDIQAYLDLFARGGRDLKQADYLLQTKIEPMWVTR